MKNWTVSLKLKLLFGYLYIIFGELLTSVFSIFFSDHSGSVSIVDCLPCTAGYYCGQYGLDSPSGQCDAGYFCPGGQDSRRPTNFACSPGHFCLAGSHNETGCPSGTYQNLWGQSNCSNCPAGYFCEAIGKKKEASFYSLIFPCK